MSLSLKFRLYWANKTINYCVLILLTFLGAVLPTWYFQQNQIIIPLILGIIAAALAESDDNFTGRIKALILTAICFAIASFSSEILFEIPWLFAIGLFVSSFLFIMLGSLGSRYASIAFGSLLISIYTMLGAQNSPTIWVQPVLLLSGAAWYYFMSMIWQLFWPMQPVQQNLSQLFLQLSHYLDAKSTLFHPRTESESQSEFIAQAMRLTASNNATAVNALNACHEILLSRSKKGHIDGPSDRFLNIYFIAQDIHERVSSSHCRYQDLTQTFHRSDILFRFKYLLESQAKACRNIARSIQLGSTYQHQTSLALDELLASINYLSEQAEYDPQLIEQLQFLFNNLATVEKQLNNIHNPDINRLEEETLNDINPHTLRAMWQRIHSHLNTDSLLFRHALRMSIALTAGYGIIQGFNIEQGYWILLTTLFVCQPNFSTTRQKLIDRVIGTIAGILVGALLLTLFPSTTSQLIFMVISGVLFFAFLINNYGYATGFITLLVLFCFNQMGEGYEVILPRIIDTLVGCGLAVCAVFFILPDWQSKRLPLVMSDAIQANKNYLQQIMLQYQSAKKDDLKYRVARRAAHTCDAKLSSAISHMLAEPDKYRIAVDESFRFLTLNHTMLNYISALGANRTLIDEEHRQLIQNCYRDIDQQLTLLFNLLHEHKNENENSDLELVHCQQLEQWHKLHSGATKMVLQQLHLIHCMLPELDDLAIMLIKPVETSTYKNELA